MALMILGGIVAAIIFTVGVVSIADFLDTRKKRRNRP